MKKQSKGEFDIMTRKERILGREGLFKGKKIMAFLLVLMILFLPINYSHALSINSSSAILIEANTGRVLYEKASDIQRPMASTSKIMTYLLTMEAIDDGRINLGDKLTVSLNAADAGGSSFKLKENDVLTVEELLNSMMIISANDSAVVLAEYIDGDMKNFCAKMNDRAKSLGLNSGYFVNPNGMPLEDDDQNKMSAKDLAYLSKYVIDKYGDRVIKITSQKEFNATYKKFSKKNTNKLLESTSFIDGFKTGYTGLAGYCLVSTTKLEDVSKDRLISVVLGGKSQNDRFNYSRRILEHGLNNFERQTVIKKGESLGYSQVNLDGYIPIELIAKDTISILSPKNIDISKGLELVFDNRDLREDVFNNEKLKAILKLKDGSQMEIDVIAKRGISILVEDNPIVFDQINPLIQDGITLVPLRKITDSLGAEIKWDQDNQIISITKEDKNISLTINSRIARIDGNAIGMEVSPRIINGNTMIPAKFIAESLGMEIKWDNEIRSVKIFNKNLKDIA